MALRRTFPLPLWSFSLPLITAAVIFPTAPADSCGPMYYAAAPVLSTYPERHPVKTMLDLYAESKQKASPRPKLESLMTLLPRILTVPKAESLQIIDQGLAGNRAAELYEARLANLLWDLRDLRSAWEGDFNDEASAYVDWRVRQYVSEKRGLPPSVAAEHRKVEDGWWLSPQQKVEEERRLAQEQAAIKASIEDGERAIAQATPALAPHWMVARGGAAFRRGALEEAAGWFDKVVHQHAGHPRHETALYMLARIKIEEARRISRKQPEAGAASRGLPQDLSNALEIAGHALDEYTLAYADGRYGVEVAGWRGALDSLAGQHWLALGNYVIQLDLSKHPEVRESAGREIERSLKELLLSDKMENDPEGIQIVLDLLAASPPATLRVMGFFLDGPADLGYEARYWHENYLNQERPDRIKTMLGRSRHAVMLQKLATAAIKHEDAFKAAQWHPKFLALMAWAATEGGEHAQALRLCERQPDTLASSDDLQYCRAVTLQRLGIDDRAAQALQDLQDRFPGSPLSKGLALRQAQSLHRLGRDGEAIVVLNVAITVAEEIEQKQSLNDGKPPASLHSVNELCQYLDVLEQFCPLPQLEVALQSPHLPADSALRLHQLTVARMLAAEDFTSLGRVLDHPLERAAAMQAEDLNRLDRTHTDWNWSRPAPSYFYAYRNVHAGLARALLLLHQPLRDTMEPGQKALWHWSLALTWEACRGHLILSAAHAGPGDYMASDFRQTELRLRTNALALGYRPNAVNRELESRDELRHTYDHCLLAAEAAPGTALAAQALFKALEILRRMAEVSPYAQAQAFEADWGGLSRQLYERLLKECPQSVEATRLATWLTFAAPPELHGWMPGNGYPPGEDYNIKEVLVQPPGATDRSSWDQQAWEHQSERTRQLGTLRKRIQAFGQVFTTQGLAAASNEAKAIRQAMIPLSDLLEWTESINALDTVDLVLNPPLPDPDVANRYFLQTGAPPAEAPPAIPEVPAPAIVPDGLENLRAYQAAVAGMEEDRNKPDRWSLQESRWQNYLADYPQSLKREAAQFQLARAVVRQHRTWTHVRNHDWPEAPFMGTYVRLVVERERPFDAIRAHAALDAYEKEFPQGRYQADVHLLRAGVAVDAGDYVLALQLLCTRLADDAHKELHLDAALALAQCFELLHDPEKRLQLGRAITANPEAWRRFHYFTHSPTCGQRLRVYEGWLEELRKP